jgi:hypothetical protein
MMTLIDPNLGVPLPEKSYAEDCALTTRNIWVSQCNILKYNHLILYLECDRYFLSSACFGMVW